MTQAEHAKLMAQIDAEAATTGNSVLRETPNFAQRTVNALPTYLGGAGGMIGGLWGGPAGRVNTAGMWGAAGRGISHDINALTGQEQSWTPQQAVSELGKTYGEQAALQGGGELLGGVVGLAGKTAIGASLASKGKDLLKATAEATRARLPVGGISQEALRKVPLVGNMLAGSTLANGGDLATGNFEKALAGRDAANQAASNAGNTVSRVPELLEFVKAGTANKYSPNREQNAGYLVNRLRDFMKNRVYEDPVEAQQYLTALDQDAASIHEAHNMNTYVPPFEQYKAQVSKNLADALREQMRLSVAGHQETSARLGGAIAAMEGILASQNKRQLMRGAVRMGMGAATGGALGAATGHDRNQSAGLGGMGAALAANPAVSSRIGLLLTDPIMQHFLRQVPRGMAAGAH